MDNRPVVTSYVQVVSFMTMMHCNEREACHAITLL
jgi:hypothetical protein